MASAKEIIIKPITSTKAKAVIASHHYSGKSVPNSQIHLGVFLEGVCEGVLQFGPPMDRRKVLGLVADTLWNEMIELNRMAFSDRLPRNSESRALAVSMKILRKNYPHLKWVISFADGTQCGDGTIYRASGFVLTGMNNNKTLIEFPDGTRIANMTLTAHWDTEAVAKLCANLGTSVKARSIKEWKALGGKELIGFQMRYIYFLKQEVQKKITVPIIPFSKIDEIGAGMYKGERIAIKARRQK